MLTQGSKDFSYFKEPKLKDLKSAPPYDNMAEPTKKKDKKKVSRNKNKNTLRSKKN